MGLDTTYELNYTEFHLLKSSPQTKSESIDTSALDSKAGNTSEGTAVTVGAKRYAAVHKSLSSGIVGLEWVLEGIAQDIAWQSHDARRTGPEIAFLFCGPAGSGKSHIASRLPVATGRGRPIKVFDMASYCNENEGFGLVGLRKGWATARPGELTSFVQAHPNAILVFDNFECAHPRVQAFLAPILTAGELQDQFEATRDDKQLASTPGYSNGMIDFSGTVVVFTTQLGSEVYRDAALRKRLGSDTMRLNQALLDGIRIANDDQGRVRVAPTLMRALDKTRLHLFEPLEWADKVEMVMSRLQQQVAKHLRRGVGLTFVQPRHIAETLLLGTEAQFHPGQFEALTSGFINRCLTMLKTSKKDSDVVLIDVCAEVTNQLAQWMEAWGDSPLQNLARRNEFVTFELSVAQGGRTSEPSKIIISRLSVEKKTSWRDYGLGGGLRAEIPEKRFEDIVGLESAKLALEEMSLTLKNRGALTKAGVPAPRGALLWGAPGTAKTTLAKAMANQAGLPFIAATGPDLLQGGFISRVFSVARKYQPSIVFIDEIDALGRRGQGGNDLAINLLLSEIDGINVGAESSVFVLAATNFPSKVDEALLRSGRIECHIEIPTLDKPARLIYFQRFTPWAQMNDVELDELAELSSGMSGADLERCLRQVILLREKSGVPLLKAEDVKDVVRDVSFGPLLVRTDLPYEKYLSLVACHEAGHVIVSQALSPSRRLVEVSIEPRKTPGRCTFAGDSAMQDLVTVSSDLASLLAGRVAETIRFGDAGMGSGARHDFESATALARRAIMEWGLDAETGVVHLASLGSSSPLSETLRAQIERRVVHWLDQAQTRATQILTLHADQHLALSNALLEKKRLSGLEVAAILAPTLDLDESYRQPPERLLSLVVVPEDHDAFGSDFDTGAARMVA